VEVEVVEENEDSLELEFDDKEIALALAAVMNEMGVDAYNHDPHPLKEGFRLHIDSDKPREDLKKAIKRLDEQWDEFTEKIIENLG